MPDTISRLSDTFVGIWDAADPSATIDGPIHTPTMHGRNERELAAFVDVLTAELRRAGRRRALNDAAERRILAAFVDLAAGPLGWERRHLERLESTGFRDALRAFPLLARRFDPALPTADIYQAARNALTMYCLQSLLGVAVEPTPAVLGYSLLYPYTDNYLDDAGVDASSKRAFSQRLADRLRGREVEAASTREAQVFQLVAMIERQYPRLRFPVVFESLLAIHRAQERSLALFDSPARCDPAALVRIAVEKGGTSVLADGYLVAGALTAPQAECVFGLGVFLQLRDDLEDVVDDGARGLSSVFTVGRDGCVDAPTARTLAIGAAVIERLACFETAAAEGVRDIVARSLQLTIADAAASFPSRYSPGYLGELERRSPFRFAFLAEQRRRLSRANGSLTGLLETWLAETELDGHDSGGAGCIIPPVAAGQWRHELLGLLR